MNERVVLALAAVIVLMVVISSQSNIPFSSADPGPQFSPGVRVPLFTTPTPIHLNDTMNRAKRIVINEDLPNVLRGGIFYGNVEAEYLQMISIGPSPLIYAREPTFDNDPNVVFKLRTTPQNSVYNMTLFFSTFLDLTDRASQDKSITLFGKKLVIGNQTTVDKLVLHDGAGHGFVLQEGREIVRYEDQSVIEGTRVSFNENLSFLAMISIQVSAPNENRDSLGEREKFVDPVFGTFMLDFTNMSVAENSSLRELFNVTNLGDNKLIVSMTDHRNLRKTIQWLVANASSSVLSDAQGNRIISLEKSPVSVSQYAILGEGSRSFLMQVASIVNQSEGFARDKVVLKDVFSGRDYAAVIISEGRGRLDIEGDIYNVIYSDKKSTSSQSLPAHIRIDSSLTTGDDLTLYSVIRSSKQAHVEFYEPLAVNLRNYSGMGTDVSGFMFFNGLNYTRVDILIAPAGNFYVNGLLVNAQSNRTVNIGPVNYDFTIQSPYNAKIYLRDVSGSQIRNPALVIFENQGRFWEEGIWNALIVKTEGLGTSVDGAGVSDVETTWGGDMVFDEIRMASNPSLYKSMDRWGTIVTTDRTDSDQYRATISYPSNQSSANIFISELL